jgi:hypothetical protein
MTRRSTTAYLRLSCFLSSEDLSLRFGCLSSVGGFFFLRIFHSEVFFLPADIAFWLSFEPSSSWCASPSSVSTSTSASPATAAAVVTCPGCFDGESLSSPDASAVLCVKNSKSCSIASGSMPSRASTVLHSSRNLDMCVWSGPYNVCIALIDQFSDRQTDRQTGRQAGRQAGYT